MKETAVIMEPCPNGALPIVFSDGTRLNIYCTCGCGLSIWAPKDLAETVWAGAVEALHAKMRENL